MNFIFFVFFSTLILQVLLFTFLQLKIKKSNYFNFSFFWFNIFFLLIPFYAQYVNKSYPWGGTYNESLIINSLLLLSLYSLSYFFGYLINLKSKKKDVTLNFSIKVSIFFTVLFLFNIMLGIFLMKNTTTLIYLLPRGFIYGYASIYIMIYLVSKFIWLFLLILNYYVLFQKNIIYKILFIVTLLIVLIVMNPISNPRFIFLGTFIMLGFMFFKFKLFGSFKKSLFFLLFLFYFETTILKIVKHLDTFFESQNKFEQLFQFNLSYFLGINFDAYQQYLNTLEFIENTKSYDYFYSIMSGLLFFIPRSIWPTKAINTGEIIANYKGYVYTNLSEPFIANLYYSGGVIGIIIGGILLGYIFRRLDYNLYQYVFYNEKTINNMLTISLMGFIAIFYRGAFNVTFPMYGTAIYLVIFLYIINKITIKKG